MTHTITRATMTPFSQPACVLASWAWPESAGAIAAAATAPTSALHANAAPSTKSVRTAESKACTVRSCLGSGGFGGAVGQGYG